MKNLGKFLFYFIAIGILCVIALLPRYESVNETLEEKLSDMNVSEATAFMSEVYGIDFYNAEDWDEILQEGIEIMVDCYTPEEAARRMSEAFGVQFWCE
jgi:hypothetical protein